MKMEKIVLVSKLTNTRSLYSLLIMRIISIDNLIFRNMEYPLRYMLGMETMLILLRVSSRKDFGFN